MVLYVLCFLKQWHWPIYAHDFGQHTISHRVGGASQTLSNPPWLHHQLVGVASTHAGEGKSAHCSTDKKTVQIIQIKWKILG